MNKLTFATILVSLLFLSSCATQFKESDMAWTKMNIKLNYQAVYRNLKEGFRKCGSGYFVDCNLYGDINEGHFYINLKSGFGSRSPLVYGIINIKHIDKDTSAVSIGVNKTFDNPLFGKKGGGRERISQWAKGIYDCDK